MAQDVEAEAERLSVLRGALERDTTALADILAADPTAQIVDMRLGGSLVFAVYHQPGFPAAIARLGARASFDAIAAGCHGTGPATQLTRLGP